MDSIEKKDKVEDKVRKRDKWEEEMQRRYPSNLPYWEKYKPWK